MVRILGSISDKDPATYSNPPRTDLVYDGEGRLRKGTEYTWNGATWALNSETRYLYDGTTVVQERDGSNVPAVTYTRGNDLSGSLLNAGGIGGLLARSSVSVTVTRLGGFESKRLRLLRKRSGASCIGGCRKNSPTCLRRLFGWRRRCCGWGDYRDCRC